MIEEQMKEEHFHFISETDKQFIIAFTKALQALGYTYNDTIGSGFCWGKYMLIFRKANVKSKNVVARIYIQDHSIVLRMFFNQVTKHGDFIRSSPEFIRDVFLGEYGNCKHCRGDACKFRKDYEIDGIKYEKCNGVTFEFRETKLEYIPDYIALFQEFFPAKQVHN